MPDMLVKLYDMEFVSNTKLPADGISVKKACIVDKKKILDFIKANFGADTPWAYECEYALFNSPVSCYIAVRNKEIIGFACYDATAKGFFGPMGVSEKFRSMGVGLELLIRSLVSMKEFGYAYAIIGATSGRALEFYARHVGATVIEGSVLNKSIYKNLISQE